MTIRILSYNVHGGRGGDGIRDYSRIHRFMEQQKIDIALFQEFECRCSRGGCKEDMKALLAGPFTHAAHGPTISGDDGWFGNLVISRFPIVGHQTHDLTVNDLEPRNVMDIRIKVPRIGAIRILNTHFGLMIGERIRQSRKLIDIITREIDMGLPVILAGDINEWRPYTGLIRSIGKILHPVPCGGTFPSAFPKAHLDRIWCAPKNLVWKAVPLKTADTAKMSDHLPLIAEIQSIILPAAAPAMKTAIAAE